MRSIILSLLLSITSFSLLAQREFTITDARDNKTYSAIEFEIPLEGGVSIKRSWLTQNSNFETTEGSYCYVDEPAYCDKFGRLYTYEAAKEACPEGWRIPTRKDWFMLFSLYGGIGKAGKVLQESGDSPMKILLGGFGYSPEFYNKVGQEGNYWDSSELGEKADGLMTFKSGDPVIHFDDGVGTKHLNSVRCIKIHR